MHKTDYQNALNLVRPGSKVVMREPSPCDYLEIGRRGEIIGMFENEHGEGVLVEWDLGEGLKDVEAYLTHEVPLMMDIEP